LFLENGMPVFIGDGVKQSKEGRKMPGVKELVRNKLNKIMKLCHNDYTFGSEE
jgi:hypothetical protein